MQREKKRTSVEECWNAIPPEERIELLNRSHLFGILAGVTSFFIMGSIAYGFDQIWLLAVGVCLCFFVVPLFSSYSWRTLRPQRILAYLAARAVARRYAFSFGMYDLDTVFIFRGLLREEQVGEDSDSLQGDARVEMNGGYRPVWITLLRGGVVVVSEQLGGARLEFAAPISADMECSRGVPEESKREQIVISRGREDCKKRIALTSDYPAALRVFDSYVNRLVEEIRQTAETLNKLRQSAKIADTTART